MTRGAYLVTVTLLFAVGSLSGASFTIISTIDISGVVPGGGEGVVFNPNTGTLFVTQTDGAGSTIYQLSTAGALIGTPFTVSLEYVEGIAMAPNGVNLLLTNSDSGGGVFEYTTSGSPVAGGTSFVTDPPSSDADGVVYHPVTGTVFVADDTDEMIYEFSLAGTLLNSFSTENPPFPSSFDEPEGIAVDPVTGNLLIVDDSGGTSRLWEATTGGGLVTSFYLGGDPEGITVDPATRRFYVVDDNNELLIVGQISDIPEPSMLSLVGIGLVGLGLGRWRRRWKGES